MTVKLQLQNYLINGSFEYWQRGTSFASVANGTYASDRWYYGKVGTAVHGLSRSTDVPVNAFGAYSLYANVTTAQASMGSGDNFIITQVIEGNFLRSFKGKKMVLTFWVKAFKTGTYCLNIRNAPTFPTRRSLVKEYTISQSNVWEKKTIRFQQDSDSNWNLDNSGGVSVSFVLAIGSSLTTSSQDWQTGIFLATPNQVNACDSTSNTFQLADICLVEDNEGQTREPEFQLAGRDLTEELQLCQRYYELKKFGTTPVVGGAIHRYSVPNNRGVVYLPSIVSMRTKPLVSIVSGTFSVYNVSGTAFPISSFVYAPSYGSQDGDVQTVYWESSGIPTGIAVSILGNGDGKIEYDAEL